MALLRRNLMESGPREVRFLSTRETEVKSNIPIEILSVRDPTKGRNVHRKYRKNRIVKGGRAIAIFVLFATVMAMIRIETKIVLSTKPVETNLEQSETLLNPRKIISTNDSVRRTDNAKQKDQTRDVGIENLDRHDRYVPLKGAQRYARKGIMLDSSVEESEKKNKSLEIDMTFDDPPILKPPIVNPFVKDFDQSIPGIVVTKIHGPSHLKILRQMLCLFTKAYNNRANRDIIVFTSEAIDRNDVAGLEEIVFPAKLTVEVDNPGLQTMVENLSTEQREALLERCSVQSAANLTWYTECTETGSYTTLKGNRIAYGWQAEFRSFWLWTHPLLKPYKYMMWMDSDVFCTRVWNQDPITTMERHDLALLFDHFPQGLARGKEFPERTKAAFGRVICQISLVNGTLVAQDGKCLKRPKSKIRQVHGFFHVSSLDFYRSEPVMKWNQALIGDSKFSRLFDDQIGITIPAAVLAGNRSWDMRSLGVYPRVFHNYVIDGRMDEWRGYFVPWWKANANASFPEASQTCFVDISG